MAFYREYKLFLQEVKELWLQFFRWIGVVCKHHRVINPDFTRFLGRFQVISTALSDQFSSLLKMRSAMLDALDPTFQPDLFDQYSVCLRGLGAITMHTANSIVSAASRRTLNDIVHKH